MKQTAVEWFFKDLVHLGYIEYPNENLLQDRLNLALEMEKQQIETLKNSILELFEMVHNGCNIDDKIRANEIYSETFKSDKI